MHAPLDTLLDMLLVKVLLAVPIVRPLHWKLGLVLTTISLLGGRLMQLHLLEAH